MQFINFLGASFLGFVFFEIFSNPSKKGYQSIPKIKIKFIELLPNAKIHVRGKVVHIHHWMLLSVLFVVTVFYNPIIIDTIFAKGAMVGGIAQGLTFPDWKAFIKRKEQK